VARDPEVKQAKWAARAAMESQRAPAVPVEPEAKVVKGEAAEAARVGTP
jgi:hypothetical protein